MADTSIKNNNIDWTAEREVAALMESCNSTLYCLYELAGLRAEKAERDREALVQEKIITQSGHVLSVQKLVYRINVYKKVVVKSIPPYGGKYLAKYFFRGNIFTVVLDANTNSVYFNPSRFFKPAEDNVPLPEFTTFEESEQPLSIF